MARALSRWGAEVGGFISDTGYETVAPLVQSLHDGTTRWGERVRFSDAHSVCFSRYLVSSALCETGAPGTPSSWSTPNSTSLTLVERRRPSITSVERLEQNARSPSELEGPSPITRDSGQRTAGRGSAPRAVEGMATHWPGMQSIVMIRRTRSQARGRGAALTTTPLPSPAIRLFASSIRERWALAGMRGNHDLPSEPLVHRLYASPHPWPP